MTADQRNAELRRLARSDDPGPTGAADGAASWGGDHEPDVHDEPHRRVTVRVVAFLVILLLVLGGAAAAIGFYARGSYYVGLDEGRVAIFKGRPGGLLWFSPTVEEVTDLTEASLPPARADDVAEGHEVATLEEAERYVENLRTTPGAGGATVTSPSATGDTAPATPTTTASPTSTP